MQRVRRETRLEPDFDVEAVDRAYARFRQLYGTRPLTATCAPDVLARIGALEGRGAESHGHSYRPRYDGIPLVAAVLAPGTIVFEGEVDEERMGDW